MSMVSLSLLRCSSCLIDFLFLCNLLYYSKPMTSSNFRVYFSNCLFTLWRSSGFTLYGLSLTSRKLNISKTVSSARLTNRKRGSSAPPSCKGYSETASIYSTSSLMYLLVRNIPLVSSANCSLLFHWNYIPTTPL
jgi:hypothetical protein